jgi:hypothetical protein
MHVGDLDGSSTRVRSKWTAAAIVTVHDDRHQPVTGAMASGTWSGGIAGTSGCTTDGSGECQVLTEDIHSKVSSVLFTIDSVSHTSLTYHSSDNHDPDGDSNGTEIVISQEVVNQPPVAFFTCSCTDLTCDFDGSGSADPDGTIISHSWDFGDGSTGIGATASHTYASEAVYTVILTVTDDAAAADTYAQSVALGGNSAHIGDLDGSQMLQKNRWTALVDITVHDASHSPVTGATVTGTWTEGASGTSECSTDTSGQCQVSKEGILGRIASVDFAVDNVTHSTYSYSPVANHDPDADSNGTTVRVFMDSTADQSTAAVTTYHSEDRFRSDHARGSRGWDGLVVWYLPVVVASTNFQ